jgi:hypothetical protein
MKASEAGYHTILPPGTTIYYMTALAFKIIMITFDDTRGNIQ